MTFISQASAFRAARRWVLYAGRGVRLPYFASPALSCSCPGHGVFACVRAAPCGHYLMRRSRGLFGAQRPSAYNARTPGPRAPRLPGHAVRRAMHGRRACMFPLCQIRAVWWSDSALSSFCFSFVTLTRFGAAWVSCLTGLRLRNRSFHRCGEDWVSVCGELDIGSGWCWFPWRVSRWGTLVKPVRPMHGSTGSTSPLGGGSVLLTFILLSILIHTHTHPSSVLSLV